jgi:hypothetical protein
MRRKLRAVLCGCVVSVLASGCVPGASPPGPSVMAPSAPGSVDAGRTQAPSSRVSERASASPTALLSPGVPAGFPIYPGSLQMASGDLLARWAVDADPPAVLAHFLAELPRAGFEIVEQLAGGDAAIIRFSSADGFAYQLDLTGHDPVQVALGPPHD